MVLTIKHRFAYYRRFEKDIWGLSLTNLDMDDKLTDFFFELDLDKKDFKYDKVKRFVYRVDVVDPEQKKKKLKSRFVTLRLVRLFYLTLKYKQFRAISRIASKRDGFFQPNYCFFFRM